MLQPIMNIRDWLESAQRHINDNRWLAGNENDLYTALKDGLQRPPTFHDAVKLLMMVFPHYALVIYHAKRWSPLLFEAIVQAQDLRDNEMQIRILTQMGEAYLNTGKHDAARGAFMIAFERAKDGQLKEMMLAAYIGFIQMQSVNIGDNYDPNLLSLAITLSAEIDDLALIAQLHDVLTLAYMYARQTIQAVEHGQIAYLYWHHLHNEVEMGKSLYLLAAAYRFAWLLRQAETILHIAASRFENTSYNRQYTILAYETGAQFLQRKEYEAAMQWLKLSLREAISIDSEPLIASSYHALGIAQTGTQAYREAEKNLSKAFDWWEKLGDRFELASAYQAMGNLENKRCKPTDAQYWLQKALTLCQGLPTSEQRSWLEQHIQATIDEIPW